MNFETYLVMNELTADDLMLYWSGDGHFIDYRPEHGDMIPVFPDFDAHVSELEVVFEDDDSITLGFSM